LRAVTLATCLLLSSLSAQIKIPEAEAKSDLEAFAKTFSDRASWEKRANLIRHGILAGADLVPFPAKTPLRAVFHSRRELDGYTVENVYFESFPGYFVTGNLYCPTERRGHKLAAILCPHGHWKAGRFRNDMQARCAVFAKMGAAVFAYDMAGWQESTQIDHRKDKHALTYQLWTSIRVVDFLTSLDDVDPARVGVTGASGGGTQTFLLTAVDPRITASAPVVMVSAHFFGGCNCESGRPIHRRKTYKTNNAEITALAAPRPLLIVSDGKDWTKNVPNVELPYIKSIYALYHAENLATNAHFPTEGHDYGASKRQPVYRFFAKHLALDLDAVGGKDGKVDESFVTYLPHAQLCCFNANHKRPASAPVGAEAVLEAFEAAKARGRRRRRL